MTDANAPPPVAVPAPPAGSTQEPRGFVLPVVLALAAVLSIAGTFLALLDSDFDPTTRQSLVLFAIDGVLIVLLLAVIARALVGVLRARRARRAGARLHARVFVLFSAIAVVPPALLAGAALITLEQALDPWFTGDLRALAQNADVISRQFQQQLCQNIGREMKLMSADLQRAKSLGLFDSNRGVYRDFMTSRATTLGFPFAALVRRDRSEIERATIEANVELPELADEDFELAGSAEPPCLFSRRAMGGVMKLAAFEDGYLVVARPVDPRAIDFPLVAQAGVRQYQALEAQRAPIRAAFLLIFALLSVVVLLGAILAGLGFAGRIVDPIRRLIEATDQVASGNLYVQVPIRRAEGDLAHLGETFNNMTAVLRGQQNSLIAANDLIDRRRKFMEAVLAGVPVGVVGLDGQGRVNLINATAAALLHTTEATIMGEPLADRLEGIAPLIEDAKAGRAGQMEIGLSFGGHDRTVSIRIAQDSGGGLVVTLDDITHLVAAQRTAAWADVARRIAHEIKNPLTPIQLSAERIRRKFGRVITEDRAIFDQCTETIVRQVEDIKRMVDEFSSFARMPKPKPEIADVGKMITEIAFMMRLAHPSVAIVEHLPPAPVDALIDRRLMAQALQNVIKNAAEAIAATETGGGLNVPQGTAPGPRIEIHLSADPALVTLDVVDNGKGFPKEDRNRLLEPYMTTRVGGTGLGLPIVAKILEDHGGRITLLDSPAVAQGGQGALVRMTFPRAPADLAAQDPPAPEGVQSSRPEAVSAPGPMQAS